jgi:hypothetical protein
MKEIVIKNRVIGFKKLTDRELRSKRLTHIGLSNGFFSFLNEDNNYTLELSDLTFLFHSSLEKSTTTINCITRADGTKQNPKMISEGRTKGTVVKLIKAISSGNPKDYWLIWDVSATDGKFLLVEKDSDDYKLIEQLEIGGLNDTIVELIRRRFEIKPAEFKIIKYEHQNMTTFSLEVMKLLIKEFGENFLKKNIEEDKSVLADIKLKIPKYMGTPMVFGCFNSESSFKSKSNKKFHPENLKILGRNLIYLTNQFTEEFKPT